MADENKNNTVQPSGLPNNGEAAIEMSRRAAFLCLIGILLVSEVLLAKQVLCFRVATADACVYYIPLAQEVQLGRWDKTFLPLIPPLYPTVSGLLARQMTTGDIPVIAAAQAVNFASLMLTIIFVYLIGAVAFNRRVGVASAAMAGLNPWIIKFAASVGPETLYGMLVTATALCLVMFWRRPGFVWSILAGVLAGLALLSRAEGIVMVPVAAAVVFLVGMAAEGKRKILAFAHVVVLLAVSSAVCLPNVIQIHNQTGYYVPDVRLLPYVGGTSINLDKWPSPILAGKISPRDVEQFDPAGWQIATTPAANAAPSPYDDPGLRIRLTDVFETIFMVIGPAAWALAIIWFVGRRNMPRRGWPQAIVGAVIIAQIALVVMLIIVPRGLDKLDRRYIVSLAGLAQIWGGLGLVCLAERMRNLSSFFGRLGNSIPAQLAAMWILLAGLACWSVLMENAGVRHGELAELGRKIWQPADKFDVKQYGQRVLATSAETACYANANLISLREIDSKSIRVSPIALAAICRNKHIDWIVVRSDDTWCDWLTMMLQMEMVQPKVQMAIENVQPAKDLSGKNSPAEKSYLIDAMQLADFIDSISPASRASQK